MHDRTNAEDRGVNVKNRDVNGRGENADRNGEGDTQALNTLHSVLELKVKNRISYTALQIAALYSLW